MKTKKKYITFLYVFFAFLSLVSAVMGGREFMPVFAVSKSSSALDDLRRDENFKSSEYPADVHKNTIEVIQIAESKSGELLVYTYQPSQLLHYFVATDINMSLSDDFENIIEDDSTGGEDSNGLQSWIGSGSGAITGSGFGNGSAGGGFGGGGGSAFSFTNENQQVLSENNSSEVITQLYSLKLLNMSGVFGKYVVSDFKVSTAELRFYNITSIYREFDRYFDEPTENDDKITKIAYPVGKLFVAETLDGKVVYSEKHKDVVTITDKYVGNVLYEGDMNIGWGLSKTSLNSFCIAFDTDWDIDRLYEAEVQFSTQSLQYKVYANAARFWNWGKMGEMYDAKLGEVVRRDPVTLYADKKVSSGEYSWYQIQTVNEFKNNISQNGMELTTDAQEGLKGKKWVLNFENVAVNYQGMDGMWMNLISWIGGMFVDDPTIQTTLVSDVSVLRLKFESKEDLYNLGVVDGASTGSGKPMDRFDGYDENNENFSVWQWIKDKLGLKNGIPWWVWLIVAVIALAILLPILSVIFPVFGQILLVIVKAIWTGIKWLFKGLWWLISAPFKLIGSLFSKKDEKK